MHSRSISEADVIDMSQPLRAYWAPGCTGCLRMKEFLVKNGVRFISVNVMEDASAQQQLAGMGVRTVPIAARGLHWADGQILGDLARIAGVSLKVQGCLAPMVLRQRGVRILTVARDLMSAVPEHTLDTLLPGRPRSYKQLGCHVFQVLELYLDLVQRGRRVEFEDYFQPVPASVVSRDSLLAYCGAILRRYEDWVANGADLDWNAKADVYYGDQTLHEFLERSVWHAAQHTRQIGAVLHKLGVVTHEGLSEADLEGLPLPDEVYDDQVAL